MKKKKKMNNNNNNDNKNKDHFFSYFASFRKLINQIMNEA